MNLFKEEQIRGAMVVRLTSQLGLFLTYNRVPIQWLDSILEAIGFGMVLRHWVATLHRRASTCCMLHSLSPDMAIEFSICQGDPATTIFFFIYI